MASMLSAAICAIRTVSRAVSTMRLEIVVQCRSLFGLDERQLKAGLNEGEIDDRRA